MEIGRALSLHSVVYALTRLAQGSMPMLENPVGGGGFTKVDVSGLVRED